MVGGTPKFTGGVILSGANQVSYQGAYQNDPIPNLDENAWIDHANGGALPPNLASNYTNLPEANRMTQAEWDAWRE